jgi:hypothetical protein
VEGANWIGQDMEDPVRYAVEILLAVNQTRRSDR